MYCSKYQRLPYSFPAQDDKSDEGRTDLVARKQNVYCPSYETIVGTRKVDIYDVA